MGKKSYSLNKKYVILYKLKVALQQNTKAMVNEMKEKGNKRFNIKTFRNKKKDVKPLARFTPKKEEQGDWKEKLSKHKARIALRVAIVAAVLVLATLFFYIRHLNKVYTTYDVIQSVEFKVPTGAHVELFDDKYLVYGSDGAKCINGKGEVVWNVTYEMQNPTISIAENIVGIADYNGSTIYMMNTEGVLGEISTGMPIRQFQVSAKGLAIAVLDDSKTTPIYIYDAEGNQIAFFNTTMRNSGYPLALCISDNGYLVGISYLYVDSTSFKTNIAFYNFGEVGQNKTDNLVSGNTYANAVVPYIRFVGDSKAVAVADNRLMIYSGDEIPTSSGEVLVQDEINAVYYGEEYVALVHNNTEGEERYRIDVYNGNGKCTDSILYDAEYSDIVFHDGRVIVYGSEHCLIHNVNGIDKFNEDFGPGVLAVMPTNVSNRFVIVTNSSIDTIELK